MRIIDKKVLYDGFYKLNKLIIADGEKIFDREQFHRGNSVAGLIYNTDLKKFVLARQFRSGTEGYLTEIVAGTTEEGESPENSFRREVKEETGYEVDQLRFISSFYTSPGSNTEMMYLYYCEVSKKISDGGGNATEHEKIELVYLDEITNPYLYPDAKTVIAFYWYLNNKK